MTDIEWQLLIDGVAVKAGSPLIIRDKWQTDGTVYCRISLGLAAVKNESSFGDLFSASAGDGRLGSTDSGATTGEVFIADANVSVGGKNYLLLKTLPDTQPRTSVIRLDTGKVFAMDADRFSSLKSSFNYFVESDMRTSLEEFEKVLGALRMVPSGQA
ncbi:MAG TPA: hypothetical protein V6C69_19170 [Trichormus sp.]|jgi:hypothetical protein